MADNKSMEDNIMTNNISVLALAVIAVAAVTSCIWIQYSDFQTLANMVNDKQALLVTQITMPDVAAPKIKKP